jgi:hypothetical protein
MIPRSNKPNDFDENAHTDEDEELLDEALMMPDDFSSEELELARDLQRLFPVEEEQLPPHFVQTLATEDSTWAAPTGLEQRVTYRVFRRLRLPRRLFAPQFPESDDEPRGIRRLGRTPRMMALSTMLALLMLSLVTVAPSFAQGLRLLLGQTGVQVSRSYPQYTLAPQEQTQYLPLQAVHDAVPFTVEWFGLAAQIYQFEGLVLHMGQTWADGPVVEIQYMLANSPGNGMLVVREFRPVAGSTVLQVVAPGAAHPVQVNNQPAIYIDGQWVHQRQMVVWQYGSQAELLYQANGLIFWITADQRDGAGQAMLEQLAQTLQPLYLTQPPTRLAQQMLPSTAQVGEALASPSLGEVIALIPAGISPETGAAVYIALGTPPESMT